MWTGMEMVLLSDILGTDEDIIYRDLEDEVEAETVECGDRPPESAGTENREAALWSGEEQEDEMTQKEVADLLGISQSYISRLEKKIMKRLKRNFAAMRSIYRQINCWKKRTDQDVKRTHFIAEGDRGS